MLILFDWLAQAGVIKVFKLIREILNIVRIIVPIMLIVLSVFDILKVVMNPDEEKNMKKKLTNRLLAAIIVFLVPTLVNLVMDVVDVGAGQNISDEYNSSVLWRN